MPGSFSPKVVRRGDGILATDWNAVNEEVGRLGQFSGGPNVVGQSGPGGLSFTVLQPEIVWIRLTGTAGADCGYPYQVMDSIDPIEVTDGGSGYTSAPTVTISGGGGSGATATATLNGDSVAAIVLTAGGSNYTTAPSVSISGGGGSGATAQFNDPYWDDRSSVTGDGLVDAAYEARGVRGLPAGDTVYAAMYAPNGKLFFFCRPTCVCKTVTLSFYPTSAGVFYAVKPVAVTGTETEGGSPTLTVSSTPVFFAGHIGSTAPPVSTYVVANLVPNRWVFRYD